MKKEYTLFLAFLFSVFSSFAQMPNVGYWRTHVNYNNGIAVASAGGLVYMASEMGLFSYDKKDGEIERLSKVNGLSDIGFRHLTYNKKANSLLIIYENSNMDVLKNGKIHNMRDIRRSPIIGDKSIYGYTQHNELVYLATGFGIVVLDLKKIEITATYQFGPSGLSIKTNSVVVTADTIYAATDSGIYQAPVKGANLQDFNFWTKKNIIGEPELAVKKMVLFDDKLYLLKAKAELNEDSIFYIKNNTLHYFDNNIVDRIYTMDSKGEELYITYHFNATSFNKNGERVFHIADYYTGITPLPRAITTDEKGHKWIADHGQGMVHTIDGVTTEVIKTPNGPKSRTAYKLSAARNEVWVAPGGKDGISTGMHNFEPVSYLEDNEWKSIIPITPLSESISDILAIAINPHNINSKKYGASWPNGIVEIENGKAIKRYDATNSLIEHDDIKNQRSIIPSAAFDKDGNLWMINQFGKAGIKILKSDGKWKQITLPGISPSEHLGEIFITRDNYKWITILQNTQQIRVVVYDDNNTIDDTSDDRIKTIGTEVGNGAIPGLSILSLAEDLDGRMWIGTESGLAV
ncbi:MAG: hypothetical protein H0X62_16035, partial [Bacteroidetes bacterium]|nr:hypothetical protein [Bacteroidota bacterium]